MQVPDESLRNELQEYKRADLEKNYRILLLETQIAQLKRRDLVQDAETQTNNGIISCYASMRDVQTYCYITVSAAKYAYTAVEDKGYQAKVLCADFSQYAYFDYQQLGVWEPPETLVYKLRELRKYLTAAELKLQDMTRICVRDGRKSRLISSVYLDKLFEIYHYKLQMLNSVVGALNHPLVNYILQFGNYRLDFYQLEVLTRGRSLYAKIAVVDYETFLDAEFGSFYRSKDGRIGYSRY